MIVLAVGDVCAGSGLAFLEKKLPSIKKTYGADMTVVNGENSAPGGTGITAGGAGRIFACGADVITTGNHAFHSAGYESLFDKTPSLLRPFNLGRGVPGAGTYIFDMGRVRALVINLIGSAHMKLPVSNFFDAMDAILEQADTPLVIVDFHAEYTSEKIAFARNFDGRASLIFGTHTHVPTADERVLPGGTAYITDIGMTGPAESVIGVEIDLAIKKQRFALPVKFAPASAGPQTLSGVVAEIDEKTGKSLSVERIFVKE